MNIGGNFSMRYNTQDLINALTGKNKAFITRVAKHQEERYGNVDIFSASVRPIGIYETYGYIVEISFGDYWIEFKFDKQGKIYDTYGNGQGHKYHKSLEQCAIELFKKFGGKNND